MTQVARDGSRGLRCIERGENGAEGGEERECEHGRSLAEEIVGLHLVEIDPGALVDAAHVGDGARFRKAVARGTECVREGAAQDGQAPRLEHKRLSVLRRVKRLPHLEQLIEVDRIADRLAQELDRFRRLACSPCLERNALLELVDDHLRLAQEALEFPPRSIVSREGAHLFAGTLAIRRLDLSRFVFSEEKLEFRKVVGADLVRHDALDAPLADTYIHDVAHETGQCELAIRLRAEKRKRDEEVEHMAFEESEDLQRTSSWFRAILRTAVVPSAIATHRRVRCAGRSYRDAKQIQICIYASRDVPQATP